jgi:hypothetical protein
MADCRHARREAETIAAGRGDEMTEQLASPGARIQQNWIRLKSFHTQCGGTLKSNLLMSYGKDESN